MTMLSSSPIFHKPSSEKINERFSADRRYRKRAKPTLFFKRKFNFLLLCSVGSISSIIVKEIFAFQLTSNSIYRQNNNCCRHSYSSFELTTSRIDFFSLSAQSESQNSEDEMMKNRAMAALGKANDNVDKDDKKGKQKKDIKTTKRIPQSSFASLLPPRTNENKSGDNTKNLGIHVGKDKSLDNKKGEKIGKIKSDSSTSSSILPPLPPLPQIYSSEKQKRDYRDSSRGAKRSDSLSGKSPRATMPSGKNVSDKHKNNKYRKKTSSSLPPPPALSNQSKQNQGKKNGRYKGKKNKGNKKEFNNKDIENDSAILPTYKSETDSNQSKTSPSSFSSSSSLLSSLDGVLPVSELFYKSTPEPQPISSQQSNDPNVVNEDDSYGDSDDEELPFSAEQTNRVYSNGNKIHIRRNVQQTATNKGSRRQSPRKRNSSNRKYETKKPSTSNESYRKSNRRQLPRKTENDQPAQSNRKMIRRGMEMLVGGNPINADPPLRYVELTFDGNTEDWVQKITLNSRDFGPLLHAPSISKVSQISRGLYCENFVSSAVKWKVCPEELRSLVQENESLLKEKSKKDSDKGDLLLSYNDLMEQMIMLNKDGPDSNIPNQNQKIPDGVYSEDGEKQMSSSSFFGHPLSQPEKDRLNAAVEGGELKFTIGVNRSEIEDRNKKGKSRNRVLSRILARGITKAIRADDLGFKVAIEKLSLSEADRGVTEISVKFILKFGGKKLLKTLQHETKKINQALSEAVNGGSMALSLAASVREDDGWADSVKDQVMEELLFEVDELDGPILEVDEEEDEDEEKENDRVNDILEEDNDNSDGEDEAKEENVPFGLPGSDDFAADDIYLSGGNGGVFFDYSEENLIESPYEGNLGPLLVDAVTERAKQRQPRVIAIGDVHGCLDELQALLRRCDYRPGDLVVFLGDLVSKGPDSLSVVQMAREIGAIGVRGNHDFEVIRWHQAIMSGADPPVIGSEHFHIASGLSKADLKWLYCLPWYLSSKELGALFVHAGFVSGIRLAKQNPRLMMNMRSILPDGTVTSKFFNNWPWARLWDGPQTVLFGHDADRGLQQYEHAIGLDTGCVYGGRLTACILPEKRLVSVSAKREYFQYRRKHFD